MKSTGRQASSSSLHSLGQRLVDAREAQGLSTAQLARRLGVQTRTLNGWEHDHTEPRGNRLAMVAAVLNVTPSWLLAGDGESPNHTDPLLEVRALKAELDSLNRTHAEMGDTISRISAHVARLEHTTV